MSTILDQIIASKHREVDAIKAVIAREELYKFASGGTGRHRSLADAVKSKPAGIIAEFKRRSPSKGEINPAADVSDVVSGYSKNGAAACSILTDTRYFGGSLEDLAVARISSPDQPLLRKDFIVDEYQIYQSVIYGADAILLIASALTKEEISGFISTAHALGLETLLELHDESEIDKVDLATDMIGINSRDLKNFSTDINTAKRLVSLLPEGPVRIAESGIGSIAEAKALSGYGFDGFLIGETFMKTAVPGMTLKNFIDGYENI